MTPALIFVVVFAVLLVLGAIIIAVLRALPPMIVGFAGLWLFGWWIVHCLI
jgi:hypothetical protein